MSIRKRRSKLEKQKHPVQRGLDLQRPSIRRFIERYRNALAWCRQRHASGGGASLSAN